MAALSLRRTFAAAVVTAMAAAAAPTISAALADDPPPFGPDFAHSAFVIGAVERPFVNVANNVSHYVQLPTKIAVEFTRPIRLIRNNYSMDPTSGMAPPLDSSTSAAPSFLEAQKDGSKLNGTAAVDSADNKRLVVTVPTGVTDGVYTLHVIAFDATDCPDIPFGPPNQTIAPCNGYDDDVMDPAFAARSFTFRIDSGAPKITIRPIGRISADTVKHVTISGTTAPDTKSIGLAITSSGGSAPRFEPVSLPEESTTGPWTTTLDLAGMPDGVLTVAAVATDLAGNKTTPATKTTTTLHAHPSAPLHFKVHSVDSAVTLTWARPTSTGGHKLVGYSATAQQVSGNGAPITERLRCHKTCPSELSFRRLTNGKAYRFTLAARNDVGLGRTVTATATPRVLTSLTATLSKATTTYGEHQTLSGRLVRTKNHKGLSKVTLTVTPSYDSGKAGKPFTVTTGAGGVWSKRLSATRDTVYTVRFAGTSTLSRATVKARSLVQAVISFTAPAKSATVPSAVTLKGRVSPNKAGRWVSIYVHTTKGDTLLGRAKLSSASTWVFTFKLHAGTTELFAVIGRGKGNLGNRTKMLTLTAR